MTVPPGRTPRTLAKQVSHCTPPSGSLKKNPTTAGIGRGTSPRCRAAQAWCSVAVAGAVAALADDDGDDCVVLPHAAADTTNSVMRTAIPRFLMTDLLPYPVIHSATAHSAFARAVPHPKLRARTGCPRKRRG